jgi:copper chaperone CopZ
MKTVKIILSAVLMTFITFGAQAQNKKSEAEVTFNVSMDCGKCKKKIENNISYEKGVTDMKVKLNDKQVWIKYNTKKTDKEKLQKAIEKLGYTVSEATPKEDAKAVEKK